MASSHSTRPLAVESDRLAELEKRVGELEEALAARDSFIAVVAHELRNPMTPIIGGIQRLRRMAGATPDLPSDIGTALGKLEWLIDRYIRRATTLLDVSRIRAGKHSFSPEPVDFAGLLRVVIEATGPAARYVHSPISVDAPESIAGVCDRLAFEQIAENLITNAIKYGAGQPVHIRLSLVGGMVRLTVRDEGPGISEADRRRIFERFERVIAHSHLAGGFGIGLWVVRQLVEAMGGRIELQSELERGSKFTVELPVEATRTKQLEEGEAP